MKTLVLILAFWMSSCAVIASQQPNVIIIFCDDLGYGDLGSYGAQGYKTPHLDKIAKEGMKFTDFSTSSSICTPSRAGLLTGRYAQRWGYRGGVYFPDSIDGMPQTEITMAELVKAKGYATALVGKWHLGHLPEFLPISQGFDLFYGIPYSNDMWQDANTKLAKDSVFNEGFTLEDYKNPIIRKPINLEERKAKAKVRNKVPLMLNEKVIEWPVNQATLTDKLTRKSQEFIIQNKENSFFLYLAHPMPHVPLFASEDFAGKTDRGLYGDVIEELDWSVGQIIQTLKEQQLDKNTLVIFTSDNGPWLTKKENGGSSGPLRDGKMTPYEGGNRVPCIMWQPEYIPAGIVNHQQLSTLDLFPTIAHLVGAEMPDDRVFDGYDISGLISGKVQQAPQRDYHLYKGGYSIRVGDWKLHQKEGSQELFNLADDVAESKNLALEYPNKVAELSQKLKEVSSKLKASVNNNN